MLLVLRITSQLGVLDNVVNWPFLFSFFLCLLSFRSVDVANISIYIYLQAGEDYSISFGTSLVGARTHNGMR